jgi:hypothetical protein
MNNKEGENDNDDSEPLFFSFNFLLTLLFNDALSVDDRKINLCGAIGGMRIV